MTTPDRAMRERILTQALRLFVTHGYHGISMREIAEAVGVSKAGLYYHFKDKQDLFLAILTDDLLSIDALVSAVRGAGGTTREQVVRLVRALFDQPAERRAIIRLAGQEMAHLDEAARAEFGRLYQERFIGQVAAILREGVARGELRQIDPQLATWLLLGMMYPFFTPSEARTPRPPEQTIELMLAVFFEGVAAL
ncbi:MAG: TetR/AcrR family transcriptional regulator [Kouleothrix sp.]|nr:TetR/AcrR family transcriptional regulator [Kouleothrix sp.]